MNDHELDRLVASAAPVRDSWVGGLDLRDAENELMEEIMATTNTSAPPASEPPTEQSSPAGGEPRRFKLAVAIGVAAALLVGVVLVRSMAGNGDDRGDVQASGESTIMPMIADPVPDGFEVALVVPEEGLEPTPSSGGPINTWVYGDLTATALTNDVVVRVAPSAPEGTTLSEPVTVRGQQGSLCSPGPHQCDFGNNVTGVSWTEASGVYVTVETRSFDRTQLLAMAETVVVDGNRAELGGSFPPDVTPPPKVAELNDGWSWAYMVEYSSPDGGSFSVETRAETEASHIYNLWLSGPRGGVTVQGHDGALEDIDGSYVLTWEPVPGQLVEVLTNGVDEATALAFAQTVRPATNAEWAHVQELVASSPPDEPVGDEPPPDSAAHRELADGSTEVWGWLSDADELCYQVDEGGDISSQVCSGEATTVLGVSPTNNDGELIWDVPAAVGVAPEGTTSIDGGEVTLGEQVDDGRLFVWEFPDGEMPDSLTFRDAEGNEIATSDVLVF